MSDARRSHSAVIGLVLASVATVAWWLVRTDSSEDGIDEPRDVAIETQDEPSVPPSVLASDAVSSPTRAAVVTDSMSSATASPTVATLEGRVFDAATGAPLAGVVVTLGFEREGTEIRRCETDAGGAFRLHPLLPKRAFTLRVMFGASCELVEALAPLTFGVTTHDLRVDRSPRIRGRVLDADTRLPVAGQRVQLSVGDRESASTTDSGAAGVFEFRSSFRPGASLTVAAAGAGRFGTSQFVAAKSVHVGTEIVLLTGELGSVEGRVLDAAGLPVAGAGVALDWTTDARDHVRMPTCLREYLDSPTASYSSLPIATSSTVDAKGHYRIAGLMHGCAARLIVSTPSKINYLVDLPVATRCGERLTREIILPGGGATIAGRVTRGGKPYSVDSIAWKGPTLSGFGRADKKGHYELSGVEPGVITLTATDDDTYARVSIELEVSPHAHVERDLDIPFSDRIRGVVRTRDGKAVGGVRVHAANLVAVFERNVKAVEYGGNGVVEPYLPDFTIETDATGEFEFQITDLTTGYLLHLDGVNPFAMREQVHGFAIAGPGASDVVIEVD